LAAAAEAMFRLAARNALHFGVTCHAFHFHIKNGSIFDMEMALSSMRC
jgi:hypothetical protein